MTRPDQTPPSPPTPEASSSPALPTAPRVAASPLLETADALAEAERLFGEIEASVGRVAVVCSERQRLQITVWICRARTLEQARPAARDVELAVARVARRLTEIAKTFWPGSVRALQLTAQPSDVRRELHAFWGKEPSTWRDATALAERALTEHVTKSRAAGPDDGGWADGSALTPPPSNADAVLVEVDAEIQAILGVSDDNRAGDPSFADLERLLVAARKLRWVRGSVRDGLAWGASLGRFRKALPRLGPRIREVLDDRTKPPVPWAQLLGAASSEQTPAASDKADDLRAELAAASTTQEGLLAWLVRGFDVLNTPDLVALMLPLRRELESFDEGTLNHPDRRVRRRLRDLVKRVSEAAEEAPAPSTKKPAELADEPAEEVIAPHALDELVARVRQETDGRRVLFVSNRERRTRLVRAVAHAVDRSHDIELIRDPEQGPDVTDPLLAHDDRPAEIDDTRLVGRSKDRLPRHGTTERRVPDRLRDHPVPEAPHRPLEEVHISHVVTWSRLDQVRPMLSHEAEATDAKVGLATSPGRHSCAPGRRRGLRPLRAWKGDWVAVSGERGDGRWLPLDGHVALAPDSCDKILDARAPKCESSEAADMGRARGEVVWPFRGSR